MRSEISNELLLRVIRAWDPANADKWKFDIGCLVWAGWGIRHSEKDLFAYHEESVWKEASKLVEFLLQDRPDLNSEMEDIWDSEMLSDCRKEFGTSWAINPWTTDLDTPGPADIVRRIKAYEYLKAWKESQGCNPGCKCGNIKHMTDEDIVRHFGEELTGIPGADLEIFDDHLPATYEEICPHCNGSKEVMGWLGKESCQACG